MNLDIKDYEAVRKQLFIKVSSVGKILYAQQDIPYEKREDLAITAHILLQQNGEYIASTTVTNLMLATFGVTKERLFRDATENASLLFPAQITDMNKLMAKLCMDLIPEEEKAGMTEDELQQILGDLEATADTGYPMIVVTNERRIDGAAAIFYPGVMDQIGEIMKDDYYILPSSTHEMIVIPDDEYNNCRDLRTLVSEVNIKQVAPEERLTNNVYHYDMKNKVFELGEAFEKRIHKEKLFFCNRWNPGNQENKKHKGPFF